MNSRGQPVAVDSIAYEYGPVGSQQPVSPGMAEPMSDNSDMFMVDARFPSVGD